MSEELDIDEMRAEVNVHGVLDIDPATELLDRLEQAEQAVAMVRELREGQLCGHCADEVSDALDGDGRG